MLIQNYGLLWRRDDVFWGKPKVAGHLKGYPARSAFHVVDFREQQGVYCLYDDNFKLVYVGQAGANDNQRLFLRLRQHKVDALADRWTRFSWYGMRWVTNTHRLAKEVVRTQTKPGDILNHVEAILISAAEPPHNRQGGRFGDEVVQYLQYRDEEQVGPDQFHMIREIWKKHVKDAS
jgi:hypothetical protein